MAKGFGYMRPTNTLSGDSGSRPPKAQLICQMNGCSVPVTLPEKTIREELLSKLESTYLYLKTTYEASTQAGEDAAMYWADIATNSKHPLASVAHIPGVFATLWTPEIAPTTAITLGTAGYGFVGLPKKLVHFTKPERVSAIVASQNLKPGMGLFGPGVYMTKLGRPLNLFVPHTSTIPVFLATPQGTVRILPRLVYVRWGFGRVPLR
jgi:hypothetical protein